MAELQKGQFVTIGRERTHRDQVIYFMSSVTGDYWCARSTRTRRTYTGPPEKFFPIPARYLHQVPYYAERKRDAYMEHYHPETKPEPRGHSTGEDQ